MPRNRSKKKFRGRRNKRGRSDNDTGGSGSSNKRRDIYYDVSSMRNEAFEAYYKHHDHIVPSDEFDTMMSALKRPLPITFRLNDMRGNAHYSRDILEEKDCFHLSSRAIMYDDELIQPPTPLPYYPNRSAWYYKVPRHELRKVDGCKEFHEFLKEQDRQGMIMRQEAVSMLPPLFMDIQPHHLVLDMCASPGSKTAQLVSYMHRVPNPTGAVIANDVDKDRLYMLIHRLKKLQSHTLVACRKEAQRFPRLYKRVFGAADRSIWDDFGPIRFDRVLADVPCSGDGTLRKNITMWDTWNPSIAIGLHPLQLEIASRGWAMLKPGGIMVYSTCSMNPIEDEAVVAALWRRFTDQVEIMDVSTVLPELVRMGGVNTWKVSVGKTGAKFANTIADVPEESQHKYAHTLWPPTADEAAAMQLHNCMRILPHHQDTGGFFVAVLRRRPVDRVIVNAEAKLPSSREVGIVDDPRATGDGDDAAVAPLGRAGPENQRDAFNISSAALEQGIRAHYGLSDDFPSHSLFVRSGDGNEKGKVYLMSQTVAQLLSCPLNRSLLAEVAGLRVLDPVNNRGEHAGTQRYRIVQEGIYRMLPYMSKQIIVLTPRDMLKVLTQPFTFLNQLEDEHVKRLLATDTGIVAGPGVCVMRDTSGRWPRILRAYADDQVVNAAAAGDGDDSDGDDDGAFHTVAAVGLISAARKFSPMVSKEDKQFFVRMIRLLLDNAAVNTPPQ